MPALKSLLDAPDVAITKGTTAKNAANLGKGFFEAMQARFGGTRLGRQELDAEIIEDNDKALWKRHWIEDRRVANAPDMTRIVVAVDPPATAHGDSCGIVVAGRAGEDVYILADRSEAGLTPAGWASRVMDAYEEFSADGIIAEANQGGDMVRAVLTQEKEFAPIRLVHATRGKQIRAQPAASLYERGLVHHAGRFPELEDQLCHYDGTGHSPDRMDALVWALTDLFPQKRRAKPQVRQL
jgi:phage terminase large subunit-like protein